MRPRDTVNIRGFCLVATLVAPSDFQNFFGGPLLAPGDPQGRGSSQSFAKQNRCIFIRGCGALGPPTQLICSQSGRRTGHCKYAMILACGHLGASLGLIRRRGLVCPHSRGSRQPLKLQGLELKTLCVAPSDVQNFGGRDLRQVVVVFCALIEVATGPCKNAAILLCGYFGISL